MLPVSMINDVQLAEGVVGATVFPVLRMFVFDGFIGRFYAIILAWLITWICRRFTSNLVTAYKKKYGYPVREYSISIPFI